MTKAGSGFWKDRVSQWRLMTPLSSGGHFDAFYLALGRLRIRLVVR